MKQVQAQKTKGTAIQENRNPKHGDLVESTIVHFLESEHIIVKVVKINNAAQTRQRPATKLSKF